MRKFSPYSLEHWLELALVADIAYIPAEKVAVVERDDFRKFDVEGPHQARLKAGLSKIREARESLYMMRWDHVSGIDLKYGMSVGDAAWSERYLDLSPDDLRAYELLSDYPFAVLPVWKRPWVLARIVDHYPVEYRAFVSSGEIQGVSSYYPQRPLPVTDDRLAELRVVRNMTEQSDRGASRAPATLAATVPWNTWAP